MYQQITLVGHLGGNPTMQIMQDGTPVTSFSVATNRRWRTQDGTTQGETTWFSVSVWDRQAETCNQYLTKGQRVLVVGEIREPSTWIDRDGNARASLEVRARTVRFLSAREEAQGLTPGPRQSEDVPF